VQNPATGKYRDADEYLAAAGNAAYAAQHALGVLTPDAIADAVIAKLPSGSPDAATIRAVRGSRADGFR
jgi:hypothetical protein